MNRKSRYQAKYPSKNCCKEAECNSTDDSDSTQSPDQGYFYRPPQKEKLQLCKKFIENGFCPYRHKCKFAHGSHELRRNNETNSRYKTKQCGLFFGEGHCSYGDRCNFLHRKKQDHPDLQRLKKMKLNFGQVFDFMKTESKLLKIIGQ